MVMMRPSYNRSLSPWLRDFDNGMDIYLQQDSCVWASTKRRRQINQPIMRGSLPGRHALKDENCHAQIIINISNHMRECMLILVSQPY